MNCVEKVKALMEGESHVRHNESKEWAVKYRVALMELAIELDAARMIIHSMQYANPERWKEQPKITGTIHLGKTVQKSSGRVR